MSVGMHLFLGGGESQGGDTSESLSFKQTFKVDPSFQFAAHRVINLFWNSDSLEMAGILSTVKRRKRIKVKIAKCVTYKCVGAIRSHSSCVLPLLKNLSATGICFSNGFIMLDVRCESYRNF